MLDSFEFRKPGLNSVTGLARIENICDNILKSDKIIMYTQKINLMPGKNSDSFADSKIRRGIFISLIVVSAIALAAAFLFFYKENLAAESKILDDKISALDFEIRKNSDADINDFKKRARSLAQLLDSHLYWSRAFNFMEINALKNARFENFQGSLNEEEEVEISFDAYALNFLEAAKQVSVFNRLMSAKEQNKTAVVKSYKASDFKIDKNGEVSFQVNILLNKNLLYDREQ